MTIPGELDPLVRELIYVATANMTNYLANGYQVPVDEQFKT